MYLPSPGLDLRFGLGLGGLVPGWGGWVGLAFLGTTTLPCVRFKSEIGVAPREGWRYTYPETMIDPKFEVAADASDLDIAGSSHNLRHTPFVSFLKVMSASCNNF